MISLKPEILPLIKSLVEQRKTTARYLPHTIEFWENEFETYLKKRRLRKQKLKNLRRSYHYFKVKELIHQIQPHTIWYLGSGNAIDFLMLLRNEIPYNALWINVDISKRVYDYNNQTLPTLFKAEMAKNTENYVVWEIKEQNHAFFIMNLLGDLSALRRLNSVNKPFWGHFLLFHDSISNIIFHNNGTVLDIPPIVLLKTLNYFPASYITFLYLDKEYKMLFTKLQFYYNVVKEKDHIDLSFLELVFYENSMGKVAKKEFFPFEKSRLFQIQRQILLSRARAILLRFYDQKKQLLFQSFYSNPEYCKNALDFYLKEKIYFLGYDDNVKRTDEQSFVKSYPLIMISPKKDV